MTAFATRPFWQGFAGLLLVATVTMSPIMFSAVSARAHEFPKLLVVVPCSLLALIAVLLGTDIKRAFAHPDFPRASVVALVGFVLLAGVSTVVADLPVIAFFGRFTRLEGLAAWTSYAAFFLALIVWLGSTGRT